MSRDGFIIIHIVVTSDFHHWTSLNKVDIFKVDVEVEWKFFEIQRSQEWQKKGTGIAQNGNENNAGFWKFVVLINNWEMC